MRNKRPPISTVVAAALVAVSVLQPTTGYALFHIAAIDELMTSYDGDDGVQFVEIVMNAGGQNIVSGSKLSTFDIDGNFAGVVLTVDANVSGGNGRRWIMGTPAFEQASGLDADFVFPAGLPSGAGMVCWGKPSDESVPAQYVDCVAYGGYGGPSNVFVGTPTPLTADGHSLRRIGATNDNANDFECADEADPENNAFETVALAATVPCTSAASCGDATEDGTVTASDALFALSASVGARACDGCRCDADGNGSVTASDALRILAFAVGQNVALACPACS